MYKSAYLLQVTDFKPTHVTDSNLGKKISGINGAHLILTLRFGRGTKKLTGLFHDTLLFSLDVDSSGA